MNRFGFESLLTSDEVAEILNVHKQTVRDWRTVGGGPPFVKVGRNVRYDPADLRAWIASRRLERTPSPVGGGVR